MQMIKKSVLLIAVLYILIGLMYAAKWSYNYTSINNSAPNNMTTFLINVFTWFL